MKQSPRNSTTAVVDDTTGVGEERTVVAERLSAFLRRKHPTKTADNVAADTGIYPATIARWLDRGSAPSLESLSQLVGAYGSEVLCVILDHPPPALIAAARQEERERVEREIARLRQQIDGGRR